MNSAEKAYRFYARHIYDEEKIRLLGKYNLKIAGSVASVMWELFGAILTDRAATGNTGADLLGWEIKSVKNGGSYEYQYHLNTGAAKLEEDCLVNHLFCRYSETYQDVVVRAMRGPELAPSYFQKWMPEYRENYDVNLPAAQRRQRFRRSISAGHVEQNGQLVLEIMRSKLKFHDDEILQRFNSETKA